MLDQCKKLKIFQKLLFVINKNSKKIQRKIFFVDCDSKVNTYKT